MRLIVQPGIRKPAELSAALTIRTAYTPPGGQAPYDDELGVDGNLRYKWRGTDPRPADNKAVREAMHRRVPRHDHPDPTRLEERWEQFRAA